MLIDTHAHLTWDSFKPDLKKVVQRAADSGLKTIINVGADLESSTKATDLKSPNDQISFYSSLGLHPHEALRLAPLTQGKLPIVESIHEYITKLENIYHNHIEKVVAVGECGLDYHFSETLPSSLSFEKLKSLQKELFLAQIDLAKNLKLPLIIHCRDAWEEIFLPELKETKGVFHSFTGSPKDTQKILNLGFYLGFSCIVTYPKNDVLRKVLKATPLDRILTETDCPFLPPQSLRGQRNEPANISEVIRVIAQVKGLSEEDVAKAVYQNAAQIFTLP